MLLPCHGQTGTDRTGRARVAWIATSPRDPRPYAALLEGSAVKPPNFRQHVHDAQLRQCISKLVCKLYALTLYL